MPPSDAPCLLALDSATERVAVALVVGDRHWAADEPGGARASERLLPMAFELLAHAGVEGRSVQAVAFGRGPGAFTGLRTACAVAQGLALGAIMPPGRAALQLLPVDTLLAVAEEARLQHAAPAGGPLQVLALLDARMDEIYAAAYAFDGRHWTQSEDYRLAHPEDLQLPPGWQAHQVLLAGNAFAQYGDRLLCAPGAPRCTALPTAAAMLRLAPELLARGLAVPPDLALPTYIRDKVAQTTQERADLKAAQQA